VAQERLHHRVPSEAKASVLANSHHHQLELIKHHLFQIGQEALLHQSLVVVQPAGLSQLH
jgi:hypothetical protein